MITEAKQADATELTEIAHKSKQFLGYSDDQISQWSGGLTVTEEFISDNLVFCLKEHGLIIAFYALVKIDEAEMELEHFWVSPKNIQKGKGKMLFEHLKGQLVPKSISTVKIVSDPNAKEFYEKCGATYQKEHLSPESGRYLPLLRFKIA